MMHTHSGFTLVEMAMVLLIIGLLTGGLLMPLSTQYELKQRQQVQAELKQIKEALMGYYLIHGHFPCPASSTSNYGREFDRTSNGICNMPQENSSSHGFVPYVELGLTGSTDSGASTMTDAWGNPYRYSVTNLGKSCFGGRWIYTLPNAFRTLRETGVCSGETLDDFLPNFQICDTTGCGAKTAVVVIYSMGKNWTETPVASSAESKNQGDTNNGGFPLKIGSDAKFHIGDSNAANPYDDLVEWISPNVLFSTLAKANML